MTDIQDFYWISLTADDPLSSTGSAKRLLERLDRSFLPEPTTMRVPGKRDASIRGAADPKVVEAIDRGVSSIVLVAPGVEIDLGLADRVDVSLLFRLGPSAADVRRLFVDLCELLAPDYGLAGLNNHTQDLFDRVYSRARRTFNASGLVWLNYFGPREIAAQGGPGLADNPQATARKVGDGLLLEVGDGPLDALTPEGEARLVAATRAMPSLASPASGSTDATHSEPEEAPRITVGGVRGVQDPEDLSFWVSRHVEPPARLDRRLLERLKKLPGQGEPPIRRVEVLFSSEEAAVANRDALRSIGARSWFVSLEDGRPRLVD